MFLIVVADTKEQKDSIATSAITTLNRILMRTRLHVLHLLLKTGTTAEPLVSGFFFVLHSCWFALTSSALTRLLNVGWGRSKNKEIETGNLQSQLQIIPRDEVTF